MKKIIIVLLLSSIAFVYFNFIDLETHSSPRNFNHAKEYVIKVYSGNEKTFYCGCDYSYTNKPSGRIDLDSCQYSIRSASGKPSGGTIERANRLEYEHVFPASWYGSQLQCWKEGGRGNCSQDEMFVRMESDIINLVPSVGQINGDRSNFSFTEFNTPIRPQYGSCNFKVDFRNRLVEPDDSIKGEIARILFYMHDAYGVVMDENLENVLLLWNEEYPVSEWELERNKRIEKLIGRSNPYVNGKREWYKGKVVEGFILYVEETEGKSFKIDKKLIDNLILLIKKYL